LNFATLLKHLIAIIKLFSSFWWWVINISLVSSLFPSRPTYLRVGLNKAEEREISFCYQKSNLVTWPTTTKRAVAFLFTVFMFLPNILMLST
jgi:hypothetical protein